MNLNDIIFKADQFEKIATNELLKFPSYKFKPQKPGTISLKMSDEITKDVVMHQVELYSQGFWSDTEILPLLYTKYSKIFTESEANIMKAAQKNVLLLDNEYKDGQPLYKIKEMLKSNMDKKFQIKLENLLQNRIDIINNIKTIIINALPEWLLKDLEKSLK